MKQFVIGFAVALAMSTTAACARTTATGGCAVNAAKQSTEPLAVVTKAGKRLDFCAAVVRTPEAQARGLMFRDRLAAREGMLFPLEPQRVASFWMKNVAIPLDIIFIREDGTIASIAADAVPYSLEFVVSDEPISMVLELAGGQAAALGIGEGDKLDWPGRR